MGPRRVEGRLCGLCLGDAREMPMSHIVPRAIGEILQGDQAGLMGIPTTNRSYPRWVRAFGLVDRIVCDPCEKSFKEADDYFTAFYKTSHDAPRFSFGGSAGWFVYRGADPVQLQRFFLTCLLRAHLSTDDAFARINVGPFIGQLRAAVLGAPALVESLPVYMTRENHRYAKHISVSIGRDTDGGRTYKVQAIHAAGVIRVCSRRPPMGVAQMTLRPGRPVQAIDVDIPPLGIVKSTGLAHEIHGPKLSGLAHRIMQSSEQSDG